MSPVSSSAKDGADSAKGSRSKSADPFKLSKSEAAMLKVAGMTPEDAEPEYTDFNGQNEVAVTLQENKHIVILDGETGEIISDFSAGLVDLENINATEVTNGGRYHIRPAASAVVPGCVRGRRSESAGWRPAHNSMAPAGSAVAGLAAAAGGAGSGCSSLGRGSPPERVFAGHWGIAGRAGRHPGPRPAGPPQAGRPGR